MRKKWKQSIYLEGNASLEIQDKTTKTTRVIILEKDNSIDIEPQTIHRLIAIEDSRILEVSTPELTDVVRLEDDYGRQLQPI